MASYITRLKKREEVAAGTMAFHWEKPFGFNFKPGHFISLTLIDPPETDAEGNVRAFSIASAPYEDDLMIATRMRDTAFKRTIKTLTLGAEIQIQGPFGSLTLHDDSTRPATLVAGGIGITPFRSILLQAAEKRLLHHLFLFYSNRRPGDAAFFAELEKLEKINPNYKFVPTMTDRSESGSQWRGESGYIDKNMLAKFITNLAEPIYYVAGPPAMVKAMKTLSSDTGVKEDNIRAEEFAGY
ncbi:MAG: FAD-dependent oxidoreductase [Deltaproteobacteria bacterium]|nr:FAD-dependent oxidoreductase [Deltaproteobacteria bacterium]